MPPTPDIVRLLSESVTQFNVPPKVRRETEQRIANLRVTVNLARQQNIAVAYRVFDGVYVIILGNTAANRVHMCLNDD